MWLFVVVFLFVIMIVFIRSKRPGNKVEMHAPSDSDVPDRKKELGASEGICLKNLSGFSMPTEYLCGIYLFKEKILIESIGLFQEIPLKYVKRVFTETLTDNSFFSNYYKPKLPQFTLKVPSAPKLEDEELIEEHRLVFECEVDVSLSELLVFAFGANQVQDVTRFVKRCDEFRKSVANEEDQKDASCDK